MYIFARAVILCNEFFASNSDSFLLVPNHMSSAVATEATLVSQHLGTVVVNFFWSAPSRFDAKFSAFLVESSINTGESAQRSVGIQVTFKKVNRETRS